MHQLIAEEVAHRYPGSGLVLRAVTASFSADGESTAILAPSGAGKTTLLAILGGLIRPSAGSLRAVGPRGEVPPDAVTAWVLQTTNVLPRRTTLDNVAIASLANGGSRAEAEALAHQCLSSVNLEHRSRHNARFLSGGEVQRLAIARAIASDAPFILADEPTGQLDDATSESVMDALFAAACHSGSALVVVTHDLRLAERCHKVVHLLDGELVG